jgi:hypothetical protein
VTGSNAGWSYFNVEFEPQIKINEAVRMRALYRLATWGDYGSRVFIHSDEINL